jgi:hypothetical protein
VFKGFLIIFTYQRNTQLKNDKKHSSTNDLLNLKGSILLENNQIQNQIQNQSVGGGTGSSQQQQGNQNIGTNPQISQQQLQQYLIEHSQIQMMSNQNQILYINDSLDTPPMTTS